MYFIKGFTTEHDRSDFRGVDVKTLLDEPLYGQVYLLRKFMSGKVEAMILVKVFVLKYIFYFIKNAIYTVMIMYIFHFVTP